MEISSKKIEFTFRKIGLWWMRHWGLFFFFLLFVVFCFGVFKWYTMVYAPQDRVSMEKKKLLELEKEGLDRRKFEEILKIIQEREFSLEKDRSTRDIFHR